MQYIYVHVSVFMSLLRNFFILYCFSLIQFTAQGSEEIELECNFFKSNAFSMLVCLKVSSSLSTLNHANLDVIRGIKINNLLTKLCIRLKMFLDILDLHKIIHMYLSPIATILLIGSLWLFPLMIRQHCPVTMFQILNLPSLHPVITRRYINAKHKTALKK